MDYKRFKHISFDLWLTLIRSNPDFKMKRSKLLAEYFEIPFDIDHINTTIRKFDTLFNRIAEISGTHVPQTQIWITILDSLGYKIEHLTRQKIDSFNELAEQLFFENSPVLMEENIEKVFTQISQQGISINLLSNTGFIEGHVLRKLLSQWGLDRYFDFQLYSDETGYAKPAYKAFECLFDKVQLIKLAEKSEILHIGDNKKADVEGAAQFGISSVQLLPDQKIAMLITD